MNDGNLLDTSSVIQRKIVRRWIFISTILLVMLSSVLGILTLRLKWAIDRGEQECTLLSTAQHAPIDSDTQTVQADFCTVGAFVERHQHHLLRPLTIVQSITAALLPGERVLSLSIAKREDSLEILLADSDRITPFLQQLLTISFYESAHMVSFTTQADHKVQVRFVMKRKPRIQ